MRLTRKAILAKLKKMDGANEVQPEEINNVDKPLPNGESAEEQVTESPSEVETQGEPGDKCPVCDGRGLDYNDPRRETLCGNCGGSGTVGE